MNKKEIAEIRRRFKNTNPCFSNVQGCYVNELGHIVSTFNQSVAMMSEDEQDLFLKVLRKALSGKPGKNLVDLEFPTSQVVNGLEHKRLMKLRDTKLENSESIQEIYSRIISHASNSIEGDYMIFIVHDTYDVPHRSKHEDEQMGDTSEEVFRYVLCAVCPVKETKPELSYKAVEKELHNRYMDKLVTSPAFGFMFPSFDDRSTNLYNALFYTKDPAADNKELIEALFGVEPPMPAEQQKNTFHSLLKETIGSDYSYETVAAFQDKIAEMIEVHDIEKKREPLVLSRTNATQVLKECGLTKEQTESFDEKFVAAFGQDAEINPEVFDVKAREVRTPDVVIRVNPDRSNLVETRVINGKKYILIHADEGVEVNGIEVEIT